MLVRMGAHCKHIMAARYSEGMSPAQQDEYQSGHELIGKKGFTGELAHCYLATNMSSTKAEGYTSHDLQSLFQQMR